MAKEVTKRSENYSQWYNDLVIKADLAEQSAVRGCMVIKPYGYAIWEKMQAALDGRFKKTGVLPAARATIDNIIFFISFRFKIYLLLPPPPPWLLLPPPPLCEDEPPP